MPTYAEIMTQIEELQAQAKQARDAEMKVAIDQIKVLMDQNGITIADLQGKIARPKKAAVIAPVYRNPETGREWSGRGREPNWIKGKNKDDFKISLASE